jgi:hypothetical protein
MARTSKGESIDILKGDPANPRSIEERALVGLGVSLEDFGDLSGIVFNDETGELVTGYQRLMSLRSASATHWSRTDESSGFIAHPKTKERFGIRIVRWTPEKQRIANLVANNPEIQGDFTAAALEQIEALEEEAHFAELGLNRLAAQLEKDLGAEAKKSEGDSDVGDQSGQVSTTFSILVECLDEAHQVELLERFRDEGVKCRALN